MGEGLYQDLWEVLHGSGPFCPDFRVEVVGRNTLHYVGVGGP